MPVVKLAVFFTLPELVVNVVKLAADVPPVISVVNANVPDDPLTVMPLMLERPAIVVEDDPSEIAVVPIVTELFTSFAFAMEPESIVLVTVPVSLVVITVPPPEGKVIIPLAVADA